MGYRRSGHQLWWNMDHVRGADPQTFEEIDGEWGRDAKSVFSFGKRVTGADPATFRVLNALFARDADHVFTTFTGMLADADAATFEVFGTGRWEEDWGVPRHFLNGYAADARSVWHSMGTIGKPFRIKSIDRGTFTWLKWGFARDCDHAYCGRYLLKRSKASAFVQLSPCFSRDDARVYYLPNAIAGADLATFEPMGRGMLARDANHVYQRDEIIVGADPVTYESLAEGDILGKDANHVFAHGKILEGVDHSTFCHLGGIWYRDASSVYHHAKPVPEIDVETFRVTGHDYGEDRTGRWVNGVKQKD